MTSLQWSRVLLWNKSILLEVKHCAAAEIHLWLGTKVHRAKFSTLLGRRKMKSWSIWTEAAPQNYKVYPSVAQVHLDSCHPGLKDDSNYFSTLCEKLHQLRFNGNCQSYRESTVGLTNRHFLKISGKKLSLGISWKRMEDPDWVFLFSGEQILDNRIFLMFCNIFMIQSVWAMWILSR